MSNYYCHSCKKKFNKPNTFPPKVERPEEIQFYTCPNCGSDDIEDLEEQP